MDIQRRNLLKAGMALGAVATAEYGAQANDSEPVIIPAFSGQRRSEEHTSELQSH